MGDEKKYFAMLEEVITAEYTKKFSFPFRRKNQEVQFGARKGI